MLKLNDKKVLVVTIGPSEWHQSLDQMRGNMVLDFEQNWHYGYYSQSRQSSAHFSGASVANIRTTAPSPVATQILTIMYLFKVPNTSPVIIPQDLFLGGLTLYMRTIQFEVVNASSKYSSFISLLPISTPRTRSYLHCNQKNMSITPKSISNWSNYLGHLKKIILSSMCKL